MALTPGLAGAGRYGEGGLPGSLTGLSRCPRIIPAMPVPSETAPVGAPAPDFALTSIEEDEVKLSDYRGRKVVLVFLRGFQ
jgi:hypothetical protein